STGTTRRFSQKKRTPERLCRYSRRAASSAASGACSMASDEAPCNGVSGSRSAGASMSSSVVSIGRLLLSRARIEPIRDGGGFVADKGANAPGYGTTGARSRWSLRLRDGASGHERGEGVAVVPAREAPHRRARPVETGDDPVACVGLLEQAPAAASRGLRVHVEANRPVRVAQERFDDVREV